MTVLSKIAARWDSFCSAGIRKFLIIWFGQLVSLTGSGVTSFVIGLWVYQNTHSVAKFAYVSLVASLPLAVFSPIAGALVDRWNRKVCMLLGDLGSALCVLALVLLLIWNRLQLWEMYVAVGVIALCAALHWPAYGASVSLLVERPQYGRANAMLQLGQAVARSAAPFLGGFLLLRGTIVAALVVDFLTFLFALLSLSLVRFPGTQLSSARSPMIWNDVLQGWRFIWRMPGLLILMALFAAANFFLGLVTVLVTPLVLSFASAQILGIILSTAALGMVLGGLSMSVWAGPARPARWVIGALVVAGLFISAGGLRRSVPLVMASAFGFAFCIMLANISTRTIIQARSPQQMQGRLFAFLTTIAFSSLPVSYAVAGPVADRFFEPAMSARGVLSPILGPWLGVGPGRGIGLLFVLIGALVACATAVTYCFPPLRELDRELPQAEPVNTAKLLEAQAH